MKKDRIIKFFDSLVTAIMFIIIVMFLFIVVAMIGTFLGGVLGGAW